MGASKYPQELRERATRLAVDARRDADTRAGAIKRIADQTGVHKEALRTWVKNAEADQIPVEREDAEATIRAQEKEIRELRRSLEILRSATAFLPKAEFDRLHKWGSRPLAGELSRSSTNTSTSGGSNRSAVSYRRTQPPRSPREPITPSKTGPPAREHTVMRASRNTS